ncbi:MAG: 4'-phosphopantetheinyl transferase superfamily protein [Steroidobacteraceae bacterium]
MAGHTATDATRLGRRLALACIDALRTGGTGCAAADPARLAFPPRGKPRYAGGPDFSIAHSAPLVACAAVSQGAVGLDVECDDTVERLTLAAICDAGERTLARTLGKRALWMAKEAALKAGGGTIEQIGAVHVHAGGAEFRAVRYHAQPVLLGNRWPACLMTSERGVPFEVRRL